MSASDKHSGIEAVRRALQNPERVEPVEDSNRRPARSPAVIGSEVSEDSVAQAFVDKHGHEARYDHTAKEWRVWTGDFWTRADTKLPLEWCRILAREMSEGMPDNVKRTTRKAGFVFGVERFLRTDQGLAVTSDHWDRDPMLLGCPGVTVDLRTGNTRAPDPSDGISMRAGIAPEDGPCPVWESFLSFLSGGDEGVVHFLQVWCGYALTAETREHAMLFIHGPGGNGKSVFINILSRILGDYAATATLDAFTATRGNAHTTDLAMLEGARLVAASETDAGTYWAETRIKAMTGGDRVTARKMRQDNSTFVPKFKLMMAGNHQPSLAHVDDALRRRIRVLPFSQKPERPDNTLEERLWAEAPQILAWAIRGCLEWQTEGLPYPEVMVEATTTYFEDQDVFGCWVALNCELGRPGDFESSATLFTSWKHHCEASAEPYGSQKTLAGHLRKLGLKNGDKRVNGTSCKVWYGISLRGGAEQ